jgi:Bacterial Ig domain/Transglutaminase-like superfamily
MFGRPIGSSFSSHVAIASRHELTLYSVIFVAASGLTACQHDRPPAAEDASFYFVEDTTASGAVRGVDPEGSALHYAVVSGPRHGRVDLDTDTGIFSYAPDRDFFGYDVFWYRVDDGEKTSGLAMVVLNVIGVNDPPTLAEIPALENSATSYALEYQLVARDVDNDPLTITARSDDPSTAEVTVDVEAGKLIVSPHEYGATVIHVSVSDGTAGVDRSFTFNVHDVTKVVSVSTEPNQAISLSNTTDRPVVLKLTHNGFPMFQSDEEMVEYVRALAPDFPGEPFERKLWRFVRRNVYHAPPPTTEQWLHDAGVVVNSLGWGFCSHVSAVYVRLARAAGYEARIWGLTGHVVPEIWVNGRWEVYDPDTAAYFYDRNQQVAGAEELMADPSLVTSPVSPMFPPGSYDYPYQEIFAQFYGSTQNNFIGDAIFLAVNEPKYVPLVLPAGASFTYPGHWVDSVEGTDDGVPSPIPLNLQGALATPPGWTGVVELPWMIWDVQGSGDVQIDGLDFAVGSQSLTARLHDAPAHIDEIRVLDAGSGLTFIFFMNALRYELHRINSVALTGKDVWAVSVNNEVVSEAQRAPFNASGAYLKPRAPSQ